MNPNSSRAVVQRQNNDMLDEFGFMGGPSSIGQMGDPGNELLDLGASKEKKKHASPS